MKILSISNYNNCTISKNIRFKGAMEELAELERLEARLKTQYLMDLSQRKNYLSTATYDINIAKYSIQVHQTHIKSQNNTIYNLEKVNDSTQKALENVEQSIKNLEKDNLKYQQNLNELAAYKEQRLSEMSKTLNDIEIKNRRKLNEAADKINAEIVQKSEMQDTMYLPQKGGFGSIPGFTRLKKDIIKIFGEPVVIEQHTKTNKVPSGILLIGPDKELSFDMAIATAKQYHCETEILRPNTYSTENFNSLNNIMQKAQALYSKSGKRTVIIMDTIEDFINGNIRNRGLLQNIMDKISIVSHATVFALSQNADGHDQRLTRDGRFEKIIVPETSYEDILAMIKTYIPIEYSHQNFDSVANKIIKEQGEGAFSVRQLKTIIQSIKGNIFEITTKPYITEEVLKLFAQNKCKIR